MWRDLADELGRLESIGRLRKPSGPADGLISFASNDYLGLSRHPVAIAAARAAIDRHGTGAGSSPLLGGRHAEAEALEDELAEWEGGGRALLFPSGFAANLAVLSAIPRDGDLILSDALNHASMIDGCRLSRAERRIYHHVDAEHLRAVVCEVRASYRHVYVVTESVFSMDGDLAPLAEISTLADEYDLRLIVDEAHATGVFGNGLAGTSGRLIKVGTLSKALGSQGGFVVADEAVIDYLVNAGRSYIYSTGLNPASAAAARAAIGVIRNDNDLIIQLHQNIRDADVHLSPWLDRVPQSPIVPIPVGADADAVELSAKLRDNGLWVPAVRPPTVPEGTARLRVSLSALHTAADVTRLVEALTSHLPPRPEN